MLCRNRGQLAAPISEPLACQSLAAPVEVSSTPARNCQHQVWGRGWLVIVAPTAATQGHSAVPARVARKLRRATLRSNRVGAATRPGAIEEDLTGRWKAGPALPGADGIRYHLASCGGRRPGQSLARSCQGMETA